MDWYVARGGETSHIDEWLIGTRPSQGRGGFRDGARLALHSLRAGLRPTGTVGHVELPAGFLGSSAVRHCLAICITWDRFLSRLWSDRRRRDRLLRSHLQRFRFCKLGARRRAFGRRGHLPPLLMSLWQLRRLVGIAWAIELGGSPNNSGTDAITVSFAASRPSRSPEPAGPRLATICADGFCAGLASSASTAGSLPCDCGIEASCLHTAITQTELTITMTVAAPVAAESQNRRRAAVRWRARSRS